jgi:vacuolar protein sorting-associated protein 35
VDAPTIALRLFLLAAQITDECGFEDLAYDLYVQAFTVYEESISESRAQLQAVTLIIGTLQGAKVFGSDNFDTLITKAALHGAKLLKKPHQSIAVNIASHLWWQETLSEEVESRKDSVDKVDGEKEKEKESDVSKDPRAVRLVNSPHVTVLSHTYHDSIPIKIANEF